MQLLDCLSMFHLFLLFDKTNGGKV